MACPLAQDNIWVDKPMYDEAERKYCEKLASGLLTPLAGEVAKARQRLIEIKDTFDNEPTVAENTIIKNLEKKVDDLSEYLNILKSTVATLEKRVDELDKKCSKGPCSPTAPVNISKIEEAKKVEEDDDDDMDLFGSDSEEDEAAEKLREERLAAYAVKKSKKVAIIAKSNIILDVKPWDDETDMKAMEVEVRKIECDGLLWGAAKLVPLAYGIHKLQISCVVEDDKVSIDWLQEQLEAIEDFVQSVDIAAFNKV